MHWISHRGNLSGCDKSLENKPEQVEKVITLGFDCEIDIRIMGNSEIYLGHDAPDYRVDMKWIDRFSQNLWIHCKNWESLDYFVGTKHNFFFHGTDDYTITSHGYIWAFPGKSFSSKFIEVLPELSIKSQKSSTILNNKAGVCSDFINYYRTL